MSRISTPATPRRDHPTIHSFIRPYFQNESNVFVQGSNTVDYNAPALRLLPQMLKCKSTKSIKYI